MSGIAQPSPAPPTLLGVNAWFQPIEGSLEDAVAAAQRHGWVEWCSSIDEALDTLATTHTEIVPTRQTDTQVGILRPAPVSDARRSSLSAIYGVGAFPLHTDGAHLRDPPDVVVLEATSVCGQGVPTLFLRPGDLSSDLSDALDHGVFLVGCGRNAFQANARQGTRLRFDPGCMRPLDGRARFVAEYFDAARRDAYRHHWQDGVVVVIDNEQVVHGRAEVPQEHRTRELRRIMLRWRPDARTV